MSAAPRTLHLETEQQAIDEVRRLRQGYVQHGQWTLPQICWHLARPLINNTRPPEPMDLEPTPEQARLKAGFVDHIVKTRTSPPHMKEAPPSMVPPADAGEAAIDEFIAALRTLQAYPHPKVLMGPIGPVSTEEFRICNLVHASHHLGFVTPKYTRRQGLVFQSTDDVRADIAQLRNGYKICGTWTLPQICWHLEQSVLAMMKPGPFPEDSPEQKARGDVLKKILADHQLPEGITAPPAMVPPADASEKAIDSFLAVLDEFDAYTEPLAPHRLFGTMSNDDRRRLNLIHCARHLSFLVPTETK